MSSSLSLKQKISNFLHSRKFQYILLFVTAFLAAMLFINPSYASMPYSTPPENVDEFRFENCIVYRQFTVNCTVPEGDALYNPNNTLGWEIIKVRYEVTKNFFLDADTPTDIILPSSEGVREFQDEHWWEMFSYDFIDSPFLLSPQAVQNIYFSKNYPSGQVEYTSLAESGLSALNFPGEKTSGYRYKGVIPSAMQLGVLFCNNRGYTFHNVTDANTQFITNPFPGGLRPSFLTETIGEPCEVNYNLSNANPVLVLQPLNSSADMPILGILDFTTKQTISFETNKNNTWSSDGFFVSGTVLAIVGICAAATMITTTLTTYFQGQALADSKFWEGLSTGLTIGGNLGYKRGYNDATNLYKILMENEIRKISEELNTTQEELQALLDANDRVAGWVRGNFSNPYSVIPPLGFSPFYSPSEVSVYVWYIVAGIVIVIIIVIVILIAVKLKKGKSSNSGGSSGGQNITVIGTRAKTNIFDSIAEIFNFGSFTGAI